MDVIEKARQVDVDDFLGQKKIAVVGVSRKSTKFGNAVYKEMKKKGYTVYAVNPNMEEYMGEPCYRDLKSLPEKVDGVVIVVHPSKAIHAVTDAKEAGITHIWLQQGSYSDEAYRFCKDNNINVIAKECILMFVAPVDSIHKFHRWLWMVFGKLPK